MRCAERPALSEGRAGAGAPPHERVELCEEEHVVPRGFATTHWWVRQGDAWTSAARVPGAEVDDIAGGPGVVWRRRIQLSLARGTRLQCVRSAPLTLGKSPLAYLESKPFSSRRVIRTLYRVGRGGELVPDPSHER